MLDQDRLPSASELFEIQENSSNSYLVSKITLIRSVINSIRSNLYLTDEELQIMYDLNRIEILNKEINNYIKITSLNFGIGNDDAMRLISYDQNKLSTLTDLLILEKQYKQPSEKIIKIIRTRVFDLN